MAKFELGNNVKNTLQVPKTTAGYLIDFDLPTEVKDRLPATVVAEINGVFCMGYYDVPQVGDRVVHKGHEWRIIERIVYVTRYRSKREKKQVPLLKVEYLGESKPENYAE